MPPRNLFPRLKLFLEFFLKIDTSLTLWALVFQI